MRFGKEELTAIEQFLDAKWPMPRTCPVCRENPERWRISETPVLLPLLTGRVDITMKNFARAVESLAIAPAVALTCSNCGCIKLFSAFEMGVASVEPGTGARSSIPSE
jgi:hypothetical protein